VFQFLFRDTRGLKVLLIKDRVIRLWHDAGWPHRAARSERNAQTNHGTESIRTQQRGVPRHWRAPIVAGDHGRFNAKGVQ
jgi:hypothetical protein